ncbi:conjugal transfer protein TrbL [Lipingzhangella sp. LS1_29]|uniref:Conjugal transfer protein TrbL n=1 Tax=Lipingzhangella rawalii TaxID=2055835 RepID=A0ABU2HBX0_9ACTN|nr:conjugal transfer protein TrbL [Lipingzhangella rawalii]MDS1272300.1 conjugal transfer protein TrbL [Lipingzhangella rawalii]
MAEAARRSAAGDDAAPSGAAPRDPDIPSGARTARAGRGRLGGAVAWLRARMHSGPGPCPAAGPRSAEAPSAPPPPSYAAPASSMRQAGARGAAGVPNRRRLASATTTRGDDPRASAQYSDASATVAAGAAATANTAGTTGVIPRTGGPGTPHRGWRRALVLVLFALAFMLVPLGSAQANPIPGCDGDPAPQPEAAGSGSDGLLVPPQSAESIAQSPDGLPPDASLYGQYGTAGTQWHTIRESCLDKMAQSPVATIANVSWDVSKTINQSTITVYQAATSDGLLDSFNEMTVSVIETLRAGIWQPLLPTVVILGAVWLAWYGLIRKRVTLTLESAVWMVLATTLGIWILLNPAQVMNMASTTVNSGSQLVNSAMAQVSVPGAATTCPAGAPETERADWESESEFHVRQNSQQLWSGLVCQPWVAGEFGSGPVANTAAERHGVDLMEAQAISRIEQQQISEGEIDAAQLTEEKQESYQEIAADIENTYPEIYPLFSGEQAGERLGVSLLALFASVFAGGLILAGSVALIVLKIGFLLLLLLSPIFLLIGVHPGFGRVVLLRWVEMMFGLLLKQIFIVVLISLLVLAYGMVMATNLGWGLQMILLSLFTLALFIYRRPFAHLFSSVNANTFTSRMVGDAMTSSVLSKSANALPPVAYMRAQKWGAQRMPQLGAMAAAVPGGSSGMDETGRVPAGETEQERAADRSESGRARGRVGYGRARSGSAPPPLGLDGEHGRSPSGGAGPAGGGSRRETGQAPSLADAASASGSEPSSGSSIPPRPAGGYTGMGGGNWGEIFGTGAGNRNAGSAASSGGDSRPPAGGDGPAPDSGGGGGGLFGSRRSSRDNDGASRWGGPRPSRGDRPTPPREPRRGGTPGGGRGGGGGASGGSDGEGGSWLSRPSGGAGTERESTPFWADEGGSSRRGPRRDIPFWLRDED